MFSESGKNLVYSYLRKSCFKVIYNIFAYNYEIVYGFKSQVLNLLYKRIAICSHDLELLLFFIFSGNINY